MKSTKADSETTDETSQAREKTQFINIWNRRGDSTDPTDSKYILRRYYE